MVIGSLIEAFPPATSELMSNLLVINSYDKTSHLALPVLLFTLNDNLPDMLLKLDMDLSIKIH